MPFAFLRRARDVFYPNRRFEPDSLAPPEWALHRPLLTTPNDPSTATSKQPQGLEGQPQLGTSSPVTPKRAWRLIDTLALVGKMGVIGASVLSTLLSVLGNPKAGAITIYVGTLPMTLMAMLNMRIVPKEERQKS